MASERDIRVKVRALLDAGKTPTGISRLLGVARMSVYSIGKKDNIDRKLGSGCKAKEDLKVIKKALEAEPLKSMRAHAMDMGISHTTIVRSVKMLGGKSLVRAERPLLTLLNNLKSATAGRIIIFSDERTWTVDSSARTLTTTKHPASVMSLGFVASNGIAVPLIWFPTGFRLKAADYIKVLKTKFLPWVKENFPDGNMVFQQDGAPAHTALTAQNWLKKHADPDANPLDYAFWLHVKSKACTLLHANTSMSKEYITKTCQAFRMRLEASVIADGGYIDD
ncbi:Putative transposable element [Caligus rogercresseyi]|uniref:Transposable element n=1 Tax=Caligus rogercresseyi TaxID=217165 RepID=A0A7T8JSH5_CALRO|nr:Putative transposable element [Caligus rogercresseyi]